MPNPRLPNPRMPNPRMLRTRVALTTVGLLAVGLLGTAVVSAMAIHSVADRHGDADVATAAAQAQAVLGLVDTGPSADPAPVAATLRAVLSKNADVSFAALVDPEHRALAQAGTPPDAALAAAGARSRVGGAPLPAATVGSVPAGAGARRIEAGSAGWRIRVVGLRGGAMLVIGAPTARTDALIRAVLMTIVTVPAIALVATGLASWWLIRRGLRPLARMAAAADTIGTAGVGPTDVGRRVEEPTDFAEGRQVAQALNRMLARIETALRERDASEQRLRRFVDDASHELRTPVATIRGYAALFRRGAAERPDDLAALLARIESEAERLGLLVDDLLALAALDQAANSDGGRRVDVELAALATEAAGDATVAAGRPIEVEAPAPVTVLADPLALRRVLDNLLANAVQHTPAGTPVCVRVRAEGGAAVLEVADRGPGLPGDGPDRVFERFYRGGHRGQGGGGAGLGLAIVAAVAAAHSGSVRARNRTHGGAVVGVKIPFETEADDGGRPMRGETRTATVAG
jgi:two-component system OmpR family sensor kinase